MLTAKKCAIEVDGLNAAPSQEVGVLDRSSGGYTGSVDESVEVPEVALKRGNYTSPVLLPSDVERMINADLPREISCVRFPPGANNGFGARGAIPPCRTCDQHHLP